MALIMVTVVWIYSKRKCQSSIVDAECYLNDKIEIKYYLNDENLVERIFQYEDLKKIVETNFCFYMFLNEAVAIPIVKNETFDRDEFIKLMTGKNIVVKVIEND